MKGDGKNSNVAGLAWILMYQPPYLFEKYARMNIWRTSRDPIQCSSGYETWYISFAVKYSLSAGSSRGSSSSKPLTCLQTATKMLFLRFSLFLLLRQFKSPLGWRNVSDQGWLCPYKSYWLAIVTQVAYLDICYPCQTRGGKLFETGRKL